MGHYALMTLFRPLFQSVRMRLLVIALLPMLVLMPLLLGSAMVRWTGRVDDLLITKVNGDLTIADQYLQRLLENSGERLNALAQSATLHDVMDSPAERRAHLREARRALGLDFLYLTDGTTGPEGLRPTDWPVVATALDNAQWASVVDVMDQETLSA